MIRRSLHVHIDEKKKKSFRITPTSEQNSTSVQGCILAGISFLSISSILLPTRKSGIRRDKYLSAAIFKEAVHSDDSSESLMLKP